MAASYHPLRGSALSRYSSLWLPAALLGGLLVLTLVMELVLAWQSRERLEPINRHIAQMVKLQNANLELQSELVDILRGDGEFNAGEREAIGRELKTILEAQTLLSPDAPALIEAARKALVDFSRRPKEALVITLAQTRKAIDLEARAHKALVEKVSRATELELRLDSVTLVVFPAGALLLLYLMRRRILTPLDRLGFLMTLLAKSDYNTAPLRSVDPLLRPLTQNYNAMVARLAELEAEHTKREKHLEGRVDMATQALLEQQRSLANTERLAALGEMMARIAHELRNPLAGVKLACANLGRELAQELPGSEYTVRVQTVAAEVDRIIDVLNAMLDQSRHRPEPVGEVDVSRALNDLMTLMRYQVPAQIALLPEVPDGLVCRVHDAMLRQALLNLILNAQQAIGDRAGSIRLSARMLDNGSLKLVVCDDGTGFPPDLLESGIRAFVSHRPDGTGLGLSMVQRFARARGGEVKLSNRAPHGACVTLELPCRSGNV